MSVANRQPRVAGPLALLSLLLIAAVSCGGEDERSHQQEWREPNGDVANTRNATDSRISTDNVGELGVAWTFRIPAGGAFGAAATNPIIRDGVVYLQNLANDVFAIDLKDGELLWEKRLNAPVLGPNGVAVDDERVYFQSDGQTIMAVDKKNGPRSGRAIWRAHRPKASRSSPSSMPESSTSARYPAPHCSTSTGATPPASSLPCTPIPAKSNGPSTPSSPKTSGRTLK